jgi:hypothetical protein
MSWNEDQEWEREWWGSCQNTYGEEEKQFVYASRMGLHTFHNGSSPYNFDIRGNILDIGGGPTSMLLKCPNATGIVVDPCTFPEWVYERYRAAGIGHLNITGEMIEYDKQFDEAWVYNVLQHVQDPQKVIANALHAAKMVRVFEWLEIGITKGHPHNLTKNKMDAWLGGYGKAESINERGCIGLCYFGIFRGESYNDTGT